jgi:mannose-1-phosphate guanylyltransferase
LLLASRPAVAEFGGGVGVDRAGRVISFRTETPVANAAVRRAVFAGAHALAPELLSRLPEGRADIVRDFYEPMLAAGEPIQTLFTARRWHDLGTPERYRIAVLDWAGGRWVSPAAKVETGARIARSVVEAGAVVASGAAVTDSVILPAARIGRASVVERCVVGFAATVAPSARLRDRLVIAAEGCDAP